MKLASQEPDAFKIESMPPDRPDELTLLAGHVDQWDWRVTPLKSGTLHLLLYEYLATWKVWGPLLVVIVPASLWVLRKLKQHREEKRK